MAEPIEPVARTGEDHDLPAEFPCFATDNNSMNVKVNTERLEAYLKDIKRKLRMHDVCLQEQIEHVDKISKADDAKIARLSVKLDHCMMDINNFKDIILTQRTSSIAGLSPSVPATDLAELRAEMTTLTALVRRTELSQAESLDSFSQIKHLTSTLKAVTRQLDSLGRNSVILELRNHVDRVVSSLRLELAEAQVRAEEEWKSIRQQLGHLEGGLLADVEQRITALEEKTVVYDLILDEQSGQEPESANDCGGGDQYERTVTVDPNQEQLLTEPQRNEEIASVNKATEKIDPQEPGPEGSVPLLPSQMLLLDVGTSFRSEKGRGMVGSPDSPGSPGSHDSSVTSAKEASDVAGELWGGARQSDAGLGARVSQRGHRSTGAPAISLGQAAGRANHNVTDPAGGGQGLVRKTGLGGFGGGRGSGGSARGTFFNDLMGQYVGRAEFTDALRDVGAAARKPVYGLKQQLQHHATALLFRVTARIYNSVLQWKRHRAFRLLRDNVVAWHTVRNRRNRAKALLFQARLEKICPRRILSTTFRYWARITYLFAERERLRLWLRNVLQHWINVRVVNVRVFLNRWKRCTVHSYYSSLFSGDQADLEATGISDDFRRLLNNDNFSLREVKRIAKDDMRRRWALRDRNERILQQQEVAIREHVQKVTLSLAGGDLAELLGGRAAKADDVQALQARAAALEEALQSVRQEQRRILNSMEGTAAEAGYRIEAEGRKITAEFNSFRSQVAVRFNDCKEALAAFQFSVKSEFETEQRRVGQVEDGLKQVGRRLDAEQSRVDPLEQEQLRLQSALAALRADLQAADGRATALSAQIERATAASLNTVESNMRLESKLAENAEYYDVELQRMRAHVTDTVASVDGIRAENAAFMSAVERQVSGLSGDLNSFVERLPTGAELFALCREYEELWVRLHHEGPVPASSEELSRLPDLLHAKVAQAALRIAHHVASGADRLVLSRWTAAFTGKRAAANPQEGPAARGKGAVTAEKRAKSLLRATAQEGPETTTDTETSVPFLGLGMQVEAGWNASAADLVEQVRDELLQSFLAEGLFSLLRAADDATGPPGLLKSTGRATFQRKLKKGIEAALTKHPIMVDPTQTSYGASLTLGRLSRKHQVSVGSATMSSPLLQKLGAECDTCVSCGHELADLTLVAPRLATGVTGAGTATAVRNSRPLSASAVFSKPAKSDSAVLRRTYAYPAETQALATPATQRGTARADLAIPTADGEAYFPDYRPESPLSQISVTVSRRSPVSFSRAPEPVTTDMDHLGHGARDIHPHIHPGTAGTFASAPTETIIGAQRPLSAAASGSTRHREAVKLAQAAQTKAQRGVNMRSAGREATTAFASLSCAMGSRAGGGFEVPVHPDQQESTHLASQLAGRFRQDATFHGSDARKLDAGDLLGPIQMSRKIYGSHAPK